MSLVIMWLGYLSLLSALWSGGGQSNWPGLSEGSRRLS